MTLASGDGVRSRSHVSSGSRHGRLDRAGRRGDQHRDERLTQDRSRTPWRPAVHAVQPAGASTMASHCHQSASSAMPQATAGRAGTNAPSAAHRSSGGGRPPLAPSARPPPRSRVPGHGPASRARAHAARAPMRAGVRHLAGELESGLSVSNWSSASSSRFSISTPVHCSRRTSTGVEEGGSPQQSVNGHRGAAALSLSGFSSSTTSLVGDER